MKKSTTAVLFSVLLFPGAGHVYLKRYFSSAMIGGSAVVALYILVSGAIEKAQQIVDKILSGEIRPDIATVTAMVQSQPIGPDAQLINFATAVLIVSWLIGIIDSFRVGRSFDIVE